MLNPEEEMNFGAYPSYKFVQLCKLYICINGLIKAVSADFGSVIG